MEISSCDPGRLDEILDLWSRAGAEPTSTDDIAALSTLVGHDRDALRVATEGSELAGTLVTTFDGWRGGFYRLAVLPGYRRRGIATRLVRDGERRLAALGVRRIGLIVVAGHGDAAAFWAAMGYVHQEHNLRYVKDLPTTR